MGDEVKNKRKELSYTFFPYSPEFPKGNGVEGTRSVGTALYLETLLRPYPSRSMNRIAVDTSFDLSTTASTNPASSASDASKDSPASINSIALR